ncbi:MAG: TonB-dependent receptor [Sphingobacteriaceae bacterium]|jgi:TonB-linked SusC/RagA family outer membrane protein|nr:TonB-dependent receptor [Sphingobacteriaceae bacterium]
MKKIYFTAILLLSCLFSFAQQTVKGTVKDEAGALPNVTVRQKDAAPVVATNSSGEFSIVLDNKRPPILVFTMIGFATQEVNAGNQSSLAVVLKESAIGLQQVVVVGYGQQKKISVTGAISAVKSEDINKSPAASVTNALTGRVTGLVTRQSSGRPGQDDAKLFIRGRATFNNSDPLVLVDGVERDFTQISPDDVESVSILKDAAATSVFGVRGANGVVLVTTKRGTQGKTKINFSSEYGLTHFNRLTAAENAETTSLFQREGTINVGLNPADLNATGALRVSEYDNYLYRTQSSPFTHPDNNFVETFTKPGNQQKYNLNLSGGNKTVRYFVSAGFFNQDGMFETDINKLRETSTLKRLIELSPDVDRALQPQDYNASYYFKRLTTRSNLDITLSEDFKVGVDVSYKYTKQNRPGVYDNLDNASENLRLFASFYRNAPQMFPLMNPNGSYAANIGVYRQNPLVTIANTGFRSDFGNDLQTAFSFNYNLRKFVKGISLDGKYAYDVDWSNWRGMLERPYIYAYNPVDQSYTQGLVGVLPAQDSAKRPGTYNQYGELALRYKGTIGEGHNLSALALGNFNSLSGPTTPLNGQYQYVPHIYQALIGRINYDYKNRYLLEVNAGYNGSNRFAKGKRFELFPSASVGWVITNEPFMPESDLLNLLKIRGSYGEVGNDKLGGFSYYYKSTYVNSDVNSRYSFGDVQNPVITGLLPGRGANENITWETASKYNFGLDTRFLKNRLSFTADLFKEHRTDILADPKKYVISAGVSLLAPENIGVVENKGYELELGWDDKAGRDWSYYFKTQYSHSRNTILEKSEANQPYNYMLATGHAIDQFIGYKFDGFFNSYQQIAASPTQFGLSNVAPGDIKYKDLNGDGLVDQNDITAIGNSTVPENVYSFSTGVTFKNISLDVLFQGASRSSVWMVGDLGWDNSWGNYFPEHRNRWTPETASTATYPRFLQKADGAQQNYLLSDFWLRDGRYIRLKNVQLGYQLPKKVLGKLPIENVRFYANAYNLITWDQVKRIDPESNPDQNNGQFYPQQRIINFGLNVGF